jgi:hypothetical protein
MSSGEVYAYEGVVRPSDCSIEHDITFEAFATVSPALIFGTSGSGLR